jgi:hypothetical protein
LRRQHRARGRVERAARGVHGHGVPRLGHRLQPLLRGPRRHAPSAASAARDGGHRLDHAHARARRAKPGEHRPPDVAGAHEQHARRPDVEAGAGQHPHSSW